MIYSPYSPKSERTALLNGDPMYPFIRLIDVLVRGRWRPPLTPADPSVLRMTTWPSDCDLFFEMNNGRHLTLFDLGRFDVGLRTGLLKLLKQKRWGLVVAGSSIRYRRRLLPFQRFSLHTQLIARDERWFYFVQTAERKGVACSSALVRTGITSQGKVIPTQEVADALGHPDWHGEMKDWVKGWAEADAKRPWPPEEI